MHKILYAILFLFLISCGSKDTETTLLEAEFADVQIDTITLQEFTPQIPKYLIIHAIATDPQRARWSPQRLKKFFTDKKPQGNGWDRYGYHDYIDLEGNLFEITPTDCDLYLQFWELTYNAKGYNNISVAIALEGGAEFKSGKLVPKVNFTELQYAALKKRILFYQNRWAGIKVIPHNHVNKGKACPVFDLKILNLK